ncbi:MAG: FUSC family protein [Mesorhizobium sp.]|nr:FUSC family protein [Mesorhizobium sp.]MBL8579876.1 FUSC family protein [Mesorhizobium sp.]
MITAIQGTVAVKDATARVRTGTRVYAAICGFAVIASITLADQSLLAVNTLLLVVIFLAVYARRFGTRWQAIGMFAFMCGVITAFLKPQDAQLSDIALALCISGFIAHSVRNFVLPDRPDIDCRHAMKAATALIEKLSEQIRISTESGWTVASKKAAIDLEELARDNVLLCESYLPVAHAGTFDNERAGLLAMRLFELQLAMETTLSTALRPIEKRSSNCLSTVTDNLQFLARAKEKAEATMASSPAHSFSTTIDGNKNQIPLVPANGQWLDDKFLRQAIQVTIASAFAMVGGLILSPERWFWAVLTAFLIFSNTQSRGDLAVRALNRTLGTAIGICFGIGLATLVNGELYPTIILVAICIFSAFYLSSLSYSAMTFFITVAISLVYGLLGVFTPGLLVLRLEETAVGVAAGIFVSRFVLPVSTVTQARLAMDGFMQALDHLLEAIVNADGSENRASLLTDARRLDTEQANVRTAAAPMQSQWAFGLAQEGPRRAMMRVSMLVHCGHILAREYAGKSPSANEIEQLRSIRMELASQKIHGRDMSGRSRVADMADLPELEVEPSSDGKVDYALRNIMHVLRQADIRNQG